MSNPTAKRFHISRTLIITGWVLMLMLAVGILGANVYAMISGIANDTLTNWGGIVMGFVFGAFPAMARDFINGETE